MRGKLSFMQILILLIGTVLGSFIAQLTKNIAYLKWLNYGQQFGISEKQPLHLDLGVINLTFGFGVNVTVAAIIGLIIAIIICKQMK